MIQFSMEENMKNLSGTVSGRDNEAVRENLLKKALRLKERIIERFDRLYKESSVDHVKIMLKELSDREEEDKLIIEEAIEKGVVGESTGAIDRRNYEMLDHLVTEDLQDINVNDLKSVLMSAMKMSNDLHNILEIMSHEYSDPTTSDILSTLAEHQLNNKSRIAELYDEYVNKDYW